ncbi:hypothetical protein [uncultured Maribacter sp.]|uniref:hypothetical protein n=1 Tax=uncultured Maribacter sp. TaxID=431308 RepID=UPI0030DB3257|tara:strand:+ start:335 stop:568 length:234 start_codon:yes stop_codon:yes gene_type:complete
METISFNGKEFPSVIINMPFGERTISTVQLNESLLNLEGSYVSEEARLIDENIFYFVEENVLCFQENEIVNKILSEI